MRMMKKGLILGLGAVAALASAGAAMAAGTSTGVEAGFFALGTDLNTVLSGAGGYLILILSVIVGAVTIMATGRWGAAITAFGVAVFLGYGLQTLSSFGAVTATVDMLEPVAIVAQADVPATVQ
ncbi:MAG: hypothetical protein AAGA97_01100 [Pseudomonadota bacterium]